MAEIDWKEDGKTHFRNTSCDGDQSARAYDDRARRLAPDCARKELEKPGSNAAKHEFERRDLLIGLNLAAGVASR